MFLLYDIKDVSFGEREAYRETSPAIAPADMTWSFEPYEDEKIISMKRHMGLDLIDGDNRRTSSLRWPPRGDMQELPLQVD